MHRSQAIRCNLLVLATVLAVLAPVTAAQKTYEVEVRTDVKIAMRDGVELSANIFLPKAEETFPVILIRSPYGKGDENFGDGLLYAGRGYVVVSQDCRGRGASRGAWEPFANEVADGLDTHKWVLDQPWCNGSIGTAGGSYVGYTQWAPAPDAGEWFKAAFAVVPLVDTYGDSGYIGGAFSLAMFMSWGTAMAEPLAVLGWSDAKWQEAFRTLPLCEWDKAIGKKVRYLRDWVAHPAYDQYWAARGVRDRRQDIGVPIFVVGGWYDIFAKSNLDHVNAVRATARSARARNHTRVLMGPWTHGVGGDGKVGDLDFGAESVVKLREMQTQWFDHWLKGEDTEVEDWPAFRIFVMGRNQWRDAQQWPLENTTYVPFYLHSQGTANSRSGDGKLSKDKPGDEPEDKYVYDPNDPVPTLGGCNLSGCPAGPRDQSKAEDRDDVLVFTSEPMKAELEVTGPVKVVLYAATSAPDTDWTAKLVDVHPDGRPFNLCDGIIRARFRNGSAKTELLEPGKVYRYEIDLWVTSNVFLPGHRIRVEISSSNFPRFDRNPNTADPFGTATKVQQANQTVYHDQQRPSHILLPIIP